MKKKVIAGAVIVLAAGLAAFIYRRNKNKINEAATSMYGELDDSISAAKGSFETSFS